MNHPLSRFFVLFLVLGSIAGSTSWCQETPDGRVLAPYARIQSVGSVEPYALKGVPFQIAVDAVVSAAEYSHYGFYIEHTGGPVAWPIEGGYFSSILYQSGWGAHTDMGYGSMFHCPIQKKVTVTLNTVGRNTLRLVVYHMGGAEYNLEWLPHLMVDDTPMKPMPLGHTMMTRNFDVYVMASKPSASIANVQYVKPPDSIGEGETTPVVAKVTYDLPEPMPLRFEVQDRTKNSTIASWDSPQPLSGKGTFTSSPIQITSFAPGAMDASRAGEWKLGIRVSAVTVVNVAELAAKDITLKVVAKNAAPPELDVTNIEHVKPPEKIALGEPTPVTVTVAYRHLPVAAKLRLWFKDADTGQDVGSALSSVVLPKKGTYVFPQASLRATRVGNWRLQALVAVNAANEAAATSRFTIKVVAPAASAEAQITELQYVKPPDSIAVGEATPVMVTVAYQDLVPGSKLKLTIVDQGTNQNIASATSIALSGSGSYTFPSKAITPVNAGNWRLKANVKLASNPLASKGFTIKVVR